MCRPLSGGPDEGGIIGGVGFAGVSIHNWAGVSCLLKYIMIAFIGVYFQLFDTNLRHR